MCFFVFSDGETLVFWMRVKKKKHPKYTKLLSISAAASSYRNTLVWMDTHLPKRPTSLVKNNTFHKQYDGLVDGQIMKWHLTISLVKYF